MKRALSLIIVLAMVLCMIPFSAFAEDANADFGFGYELIDTTEVVLNSENKQTMRFYWVATEKGDVSFDISWPDGVAPEGVSITIDLDDSEDDYTMGDWIPVEAGSIVGFDIYEDNYIDCTFNLFPTFRGEPGTETNPYFIKNPAVAEEGEEVETSVTVPGNSTTVYCNLYGFAGQTVIVEGNGVKVTYNDISYGSINTVDGVLKLEDTAVFEIAAGTPSAAIQLINKSDAEVTYTFSTKAPVIGTVDNPQVVTADEYQVELAAGNQGYYYTYFAEGDGTVTVNVYAQDAEGNTLGTMLAVNNLTSYVYGDQTTEGTWSVEVATGDEISIMASTFNKADPWNAPAGTVTTVIAFAETEPEPEVGIDWGSVLGGTTSQANNTEAEVMYTYTVEQDGMMYRSDYGFTFLVSAGDKINITIWPGETVELYYASPVAKIGDVEYYAFDEAVASAMYGDTIVLLADVTSEWDGIMLNPGINMDLGEFTLTAPYFVAFGSVTGVPGSASIVADDVMLNNVTIADVEYAWTAGENGAYTLVEYKAPVVEDEEPIVAEFGGEQMSLSAALAAAAASAPTAENRAVVTLIANAEVDYNVIIDPYVTLNIAGYTLTAPNVIGLTNSMINAVVPTLSGCTDGGKIFVPTKDNLVMSAEIHDGSQTGSKLLPVWNCEASVGHYLFTNIKNEFDRSFDVTGTSGYETYKSVMFVEVKHTWCDSVVKTLLHDMDGDAAENALAFTYEASWDYYGVIRVYQQYVMVDMYNNFATGGTYNGDTGELDGLVDYTIQNQVVSDTGAIFYGTLFKLA